MESQGRRHDSVAFCRSLRRAGLSIPVDATAGFVTAIGLLGDPSGTDVYWAGRATLVRCREDIDVYDDVFRAFFLGTDQQRVVLEAEQVVAFDTADDTDDDTDDDDTDDDDDSSNDGAENPELDVARSVRFSRVERLADKDFSMCSPGELAELYRAIDRLRLDAPVRRSTRTIGIRSSKGAIHLRHTVARSMRTGGELVELSRRRRTERRRRIVLLVDVSGSMADYARALVRFAHALTSSGSRVEVFAVGTRLTRLTRELETRDPDQALAAAAAAVVDWSGGTRLGSGLEAFCREWGQRGMARGATVVILSDGWDRGDPTELGEQMARLARLAHRIVWVNPLKATDGYAPLARGMAAALPYCDHFVEGHSLRSLDDLASVLAGTMMAS